MVPVELREYFSDVVDNQLRQLAIMVFNYKTKEFTVFVVDYLADLFFEGKR